jgi:hypothetical protein
MRYLRDPFAASLAIALASCGLFLLDACGGSSSVDTATHLWVAAPAMATAGTPIDVTVTALDATNKVVTGYSGTVHLSSSDSQAVLPKSSALTNGSVTFSTTLRAAGSQTITATDTVTGSITGTSSAIAVSAGPATHLSLSAITTTQSGSAFDITITARDAANNVANGYTGTVHFSSTDPQAALPANATLTDGTGTFSTTLRAAGGQTITATDIVTASITGTSPSINVGSGPATHFTVVSPAAAQAATAFRFTVTARDAANNVVSSYSGTVQFSSTDAQAMLPPISTLTNGTGSFPATLVTIGSQTLTATDTLTASITGTSSSITVSTMPPPFHFSVAAPTTAQSGTSFNFTVTALNTANEVANNYTGTVQFSSTDSQAILPASSTLKNGTGSYSATLQTAGSQTLTATDSVMGSITGTSSSIDVSPGPATHFSVSAPNAVEQAKPFTLIVTARDAANNLVASYAGSVNFSSTDAQAVLAGESPLTNGMGVFSATLKTKGTQMITATDMVTASIEGTSNRIDVITDLCLTRGARCSLAPGSTPCCPPSLRCICIPGGPFGGCLYSCQW